MASTRLEILKQMVADRPADSFLRYGLAMEYRNRGDLVAALAEFTALMSADPDYAPAYFHAGQTLEQLGKLEEAPRLLRAEPPVRPAAKLERAARWSAVPEGLPKA